MPVEPLNKEGIFKYLRPDQIDVLSKYADLMDLKAGAYVYHRGANAKFFYVVISGRVLLQIPGKKKNADIIIEQLGEGGVFGRCISFSLNSYFLDAKCLENTQVLRINADVLREILEEDLHMGYHLQSEISRVYYLRYIDTMKKLQAMVQNIPADEKSDLSGQAAF